VDCGVEMEVMCCSTHSRAVPRRKEELQHDAATRKCASQDIIVGDREAVTRLGVDRTIATGDSAFRQFPAEGFACSLEQCMSAQGCQIR